MEEALIKRVMPHSIEAEQSVVGAMLMDKDAITTAGEIISGDDFYQASYGVIFDSMIELFNEGKPVDLITLQERLKEIDFFIAFECGSGYGFCRRTWNGCGGRSSCHHHFPVYECIFVPVPSDEKKPGGVYGFP